MKRYNFEGRVKLRRSKAYTQAQRRLIAWTERSNNPDGWSGHTAEECFLKMGIAQREVDDLNRKFARHIRTE